MSVARNTGKDSIATEVDYKALLNSAPNLYLILLPDTPKFTIVAVSDAYAYQTLTKREDIIGRGLFDVFPDNPDDPTADGVSNLRKSLEFVINHQMLHRMDDQKYDIRRIDGTFETRYWRPLNSPAFNDKKELVYIIHRVEDVTELLRIQQEQEKNRADLMASEERFRMLLESAPDAVVILDEAGLIQLVNIQAEKVFEYDRGELLGKSVDVLIPGLFLNTEVSHLLGERIELFCNKKDGTEFPAEISLSPIESESGVLISAAIRDVTVRKANEAKIRELNATLEKKVEERTVELANTNKELEQFAYVASHDLQEPLRMVSSFLQLLQKKYSGQLDEKAEGYINYAVDGSERMKRLILDLLEYSRIGTNADNFVDVDLKEVLEYLNVIFENELQETSATINYSSLPTIRANKTQITQLFQNLISNSLKYRSDKKPVITITVTDKAKYWEFAFSDNGIGIDKQFFNKIFIVFQRLHNVSEYSGTGIGLALCKKIVEAHKGKIWIESAIGHGTTFYFTIAKTL
jgi:PAS domain S-box-containing protein